MRIFLLFLFLAFNHVYSQNTLQKLLTAVKNLEADSQMRHAILGFCVVDAKTGKKVYSHDASIGLAAASTQKLFTSGAAFELLGHDYRYVTELGYYGKIENGELIGSLVIQGSCDPTFGSWRYDNTKEDSILNNFTRSVKQNNINKIDGYIVSHTPVKIGDNDLPIYWNNATIPDGWIWQDIGNYYGAGADILNWRENQYDLVLHRTDFPGQKVTIAGTKPSLHIVDLQSKVTTAGENSGDNAYIYLPPLSNRGIVRGTIPLGKTDFTISGSIPNPSGELIITLNDKLEKEGIALKGDDEKGFTGLDLPPHIIFKHYSPTLDSINYWFLKRSINLYGEALIKTIAWEKGADGSTEKGVEKVKDFWSKIGIDKAAINIIDGSGLSPQNRVTAEAEVKVLQYAKTRPWFNSFYNALPEMNGMKMKSGAIGGARAFAGYHTAKNGAQYIFSIIVNNYDGSSSEIIKKMYTLLDVLK